VHTQPTLTPAQRATLAAVTARVLDGARELAPGDGAEAVEARLERAPAHVRTDVARVLDAFGGRVAALATVGVPLPFARLDAERQDRMLARWERSRVPVQRTMFQALRRLVLATWYGRPEVQAAMGHPGPLHGRTPSLPWEGPAPGASTPAEPIARREAPGSVAPPVRSVSLAGVVPGAACRGEVRRTADVVVVGSGAGGAVAAARLAEAGLEVVVLESGGLWTAADFTEREAEMTEHLYADQGLQATEDLGVALFQGNTVGGGTTVNWMAMLRPEPHVRAEWARRFGVEVAVRREMDAALDRVWADVHARPMPADAHSANNRLLLDGAAALGWRVRALELNARGCVRSGFCGLGCRYDAKQGTLLTYVPRALAAGAVVHADAVVDRIEDRGGVHRVHARLHDRDSRRPTATLVVDAARVVLAAGAVGTPAILERSGMGGGGVGCFLRVHPTSAVSGLYGHEVQANTGVPMSAICDHFSAAGPHGYGFWLEAPPLQPSVAAVGTAGFGRAHFRAARDYPRLGALVALVRDGAELERSSGGVRLDRTGRVRIRYRLSPADARLLREAMAAAARVHLAAGAREVRTLHTEPLIVRSEAGVAEVLRRSTAPNDLTVFSAHVNGTCRLGRDPQTSGAASDTARLGQRHGAPGVWIADGSLLPTGLGVNPQATIMALAHLVADAMLGG
jgi:choline dehydrogenase-like flavoprotein